MPESSRFAIRIRSGEKRMWLIRIYRRAVKKDPCCLNAMPNFGRDGRNKCTSHAIEMVFVFIATGHAGSSARSFML